VGTPLTAALQHLQQSAAAQLSLMQCYSITAATAEKACTQLCQQDNIKYPTSHARAESDTCTCRQDCTAKHPASSISSARHGLHVVRVLLTSTNLTAAVVMLTLFHADGCDVVNLSLGGALPGLLDTYPTAIMNAAGTCGISRTHRPSTGDDCELSSVSATLNSNQGRQHMIQSSQ
jgi:hypothetical protein